MAMIDINFDEGFINSLKSDLKSLSKNKNYKHISDNDNYKSLLGIFLDAFEVCNNYGIQCKMDDAIVKQFEKRFADVMASGDKAQIFEKEMLQYLTYFQSQILVAMKSYANNFKKDFYKKHPIYVGNPQVEAQLESELSSLRSAQDDMMASFIVNFNALNEKKDSAPYIQRVSKPGGADPSFVVAKTEADLIALQNDKKIVLGKTYSLRDFVVWANNKATGGFKDAQFNIASRGFISETIGNNRELFEEFFDATRVVLESQIASKEHMPAKTARITSTSIERRRHLYAGYGIPSFIDYLDGWGKYVASPSYENDADVKKNKSGAVKSRKNDQYYTQKEYQDYIRSEVFGAYVAEMCIPTAKTAQNDTGLPVETVVITSKAEYNRLKKLQATDPNFPKCVEIEYRTKQLSKAQQRVISLVMAGVITFNATAPSLKLIYNSIRDLIENEANNPTPKPPKPGDESGKKPTPVNPAERSEEDDNSPQETSDPSGNVSVDDHDPTKPDNQPIPNENGDKKGSDTSITPDGTTENVPRDVGDDNKQNDQGNTSSGNIAENNEVNDNGDVSGDNDDYPLPTEDGTKKGTYVDESQGGEYEGRISD